MNQFSKFLFSLSVMFDSCDPMACSTPGFPVGHHLKEFVQTHVHWVGDAIQPSHPLSSPSASNLSSIRVFSNESALLSRWPKYWSFGISLCNEYSGLYPLRLTGLISLLSKGLLSLLQHHSSEAISSFLLSCCHIRTWLLEKP